MERSRGGESLKRTLFADGVEELIAEKNIASIADFLAARANQRNVLLYAGEGGYPALPELPEESLLSFKRHVFTLLRVYLLVNPYTQHQNFVQQLLDAFLLMLGKLPTTTEFE